MPGRINDDDIEHLRQRADLAAVVGDYTGLKRVGSRLKGLCPLHQEKSPSFHVDPGRGLFHCFGCGEGGDVFAFLQKIEALTFPESVERLARMVGYELRYEAMSPGQRQALGRRTRLAQALAEAATYFQSCLVSEEAQPARAYAAERGMAEEDVAHFGLGWAPDRWDGLVRHLVGSFEVDELIEAGLVVQGRHGPIDRFRGRLMFPIYDKSGKDVIAFGGRVLPDSPPRTGSRDGDVPKYVNSPESPVYRKAETLYALNWARAEMQRRDTALVVEGYTDVIGLHLAGVRHAVATCGTALTTEHFRLLEKFARRVVIALDADDAGYAAADRARALAAEAGLREVGVLALSPGQDPADLAAEGAEAVEAALEGTQTAVEFQISHLLRTADTDTPEAQVDAYRRVFPLLARLPDRFLRYRYIRDLVAPATRLSADRIEEDLDAELARQREAGPPGAAGHGASGDGRADPGATDGATSTSGGPGDVAGGQVLDPQMWLERQVLQAALQSPDVLPESWELVTADDFRAPMSQQLFSAISQASAPDLDAVLAALPDEQLRGRVRALAVAAPEVDPEPGKLASLVADLRAAKLQREREAMREDLTAVNRSTDPQRHRDLITRIAELDRRRREILEGREA